MEFISVIINTQRFINTWGVCFSFEVQNAFATYADKISILSHFPTETGWLYTVSVVSAFYQFKITKSNFKSLIWPTTRMNLFFLLFTFIIIKIYFIPLSTQSREISLKNFERTFLEISKTLSIEQLQYVSNFPTSLDCNYTSSYDLSRQVDKQHVNTSMPSSSGFIHTSRRSRSSLYFSSELLPYLEENDLIRYKDILPVSFLSNWSKTFIMIFVSWKNVLKSFLRSVTQYI